MNKMKQLEEKVKADTERAMVGVPGGVQPENPLESQPNGDIYCHVCECNMNSGVQAQSHIVGIKHRSRMDRYVRGHRGRGRGRGGYSGNRVGIYGERQPVPLMTVKVSEQIIREEAENEYERVFAESLANNADVEEASMKAELAKQSAMSFSEDVMPEDSAVVKQFHLDDHPSFPPEGIFVVSEATGDKPGAYHCKMCSILLPSEGDLEEHLVSPMHENSSQKKPPLEQNELSAVRGRGKIYRGKPNAGNTGSVKAQRGRRGLISFGEVMPEKLTKSQKKAQPNDIASIIAQKSYEAAEVQGDSSDTGKKVMPLLMSFVKGGVLDGNS